MSSILGLDASDGIFVNANGSTGEMIQDPNTGELKIVVGSNQPLGGGAGGTTAAGPSGAPSQGIATNTLVKLLQNAPTWAFPVAIFIVVLLIGTSLLRRR
jgi:hypothetical protein